MSRRSNKNRLLEQVTVEAYAAEGKALSRIDGKVIFIEGAVPGDIVDVWLTKNKKDWAEGKAIRFHVLSDERIRPFCEHFGICGGCQWQMLPYEKQLEYKQNEVEQNLRRLGNITLPPLMPILGAEQTVRYRNKLEFTFSNRRYKTREELDTSTSFDKEQDDMALGFHAPRIFDKVIDINTCHLMAEPANLIKNTIRQFAIEHHCAFYDIRQHSGWLRNLIIRICTTGEVMVNVCLAYEDTEMRLKLLDDLLMRVTSITTLLYTINSKKNDSLHDLSPVIYFGKGYIMERMEDFEFKISPKSFFQTNTQQAEKLYRVVRNFAELTGKETVYDLYCGTGSIGIFLSREANKVIGVDWVSEAILDANENAALNKIDHAAFFPGDVIDVCDDAFFNLHGKPDVIITDPPRAGMHAKLVNKILEMQAPLVVYVSCNSATQARDLHLLQEKYEITRVQPVDMFPHTLHIENVVQLKLK